MYARVIRDDSVYVRRINLYTVFVVWKTVDDVFNVGLYTPQLPSLEPLNKLRYDVV